eukprot:TRINITY_DN7064_c0_g1_i1.p1 TRINITY_DN7064_c0_g1~~TRINITY_DN7064_c0_g1_i1.p1  ORF type:complete len:71 (-),score=3.71 TRINITY_DN7064_c0_g1_i1:153-365(-)
MLLQSKYNAIFRTNLIYTSKLENYRCTFKIHFNKGHKYYVNELHHFLFLHFFGLQDYELGVLIFVFCRCI